MEYTSPEIANYNISITVLKSIVSDIQGSVWFSIIVDEATDISRNEHMSLSINGLMTTIKSMRSV